MQAFTLSVHSTAFSSYILQNCNIKSQKQVHLWMRLWHDFRYDLFTLLSNSRFYWNRYAQYSYPVLQYFSWILILPFLFQTSYYATPPITLKVTSWTIPVRPSEKDTGIITADIFSEGFRWPVDWLMCCITVHTTVFSSFHCFLTCFIQFSCIIVNHPT